MSGSRKSWARVSGSRKSLGRVSGSRKSWGRVSGSRKSWGRVSGRKVSRNMVSGSWVNRGNRACVSCTSCSRFRYNTISRDVVRKVSSLYCFSESLMVDYWICKSINDGPPVPSGLRCLLQELDYHLSQAVLWQTFRVVDGLDLRCRQTQC